MIFCETKVEHEVDIESLVSVQKTILSEVNDLNLSIPEEKARRIVLFEVLSFIAEVIGARRLCGMIDVLHTLRNSKTSEEIAKELDSVATLIELKRSRSETA